MSLIKNTLDKIGLTNFCWMVWSLITGSHALYELGWFKSVLHNTSIDRKNSPVPWITYPAISLLETRVNKKMKVFEYGSGNSTLWWAKHVSKVYSCEHNKNWYQKVKNGLPRNVIIRYIALNKNGDYSTASTRSKLKFDIIVVDGRDRVNCAKYAVEALSKRGVIVWDNTDRKRYTKGITSLTNAGFKRLDLHGMAPIIPVMSVTTIFYRSNNCLNI